jgi:hypothetical protein
MSKHRNHVDRMRAGHGNAWLRGRVAELEKLNRSAPVTVYNINSPTYVIYCPRLLGGRKGEKK